MYCQNCGEQIKSNAKFCIKCGCPIENCKEKDTDDVFRETKNIGSNETSQFFSGVQFDEDAIKGVGERYKLQTTGYASFHPIYHRITTFVDFGCDRMYIDIKPKSKNKTPIVFYEDIVGISISNKWFPSCIFMSALCLFLTLLIWKNTQITLHLRNGTNVCLYTSLKSTAKDFVNKLSNFVDVKCDG